MRRSVALHRFVKRHVVLNGAFSGVVRFAEISGATLKPSRYRKSVQLHRRSLEVFICAVGASFSLLHSKNDAELPPNCCSANTRPLAESAMPGNAKSRLKITYTEICEPGAGRHQIAA
jgi:hypothetical protein